MSKQIGTQPKSGENAPMEFRCIGVKIDAVELSPSEGTIFDLDALSSALNDLQDEAAFTGRVIVSQDVMATRLNPGVILYTIRAQWIGMETLKQMQRQNALMAGLNGGPRGVV